MKISSLLQANMELTIAMNHFRVSTRQAEQQLVNLAKALSIRMPSPFFVCGTINKKSLNFYDYNIDKCLHDKKYKTKKFL